MPGRYPAIAAFILILCRANAAQQPITWGSTVVLDSNPTSWARMAQLSDGSWLAAYMFATTPNRIRVQRSFDSMRTWQFITDVVEDGRDLDNPELLVMPNGIVELAIRSVIVGQSYWIETYQSLDNGNSFQYQSQVDWDHHVAGVFEPYLYLLPNGQLAVFYTNDTHEQDTPSYSQVLSEKVSGDGGFTWGPEIYAIGQPGASRPGEANIVPLPDGELAMFFEMCGTENCLGHVSYSSDGMSWSGEGPIIPYTFQDIQAVEMTNGLIVATSNLHEVVVSADYTNSWIDTKQTVFTYGSWPGVYQTGPNEFAIVMTGAGEQNQVGEYIRFGTITPALVETTPSGILCRNPTLTRPQNCH